MLEHAYQSVRNVFSTTSEGKLVGGDGCLNQLESLPGHWPLAKLTLPLKFGVNRLDGLLVGYLMELRATHSDPSKCRRQISSFAKTLTVRVATYLAKEIAALFRPVLYHPLMSLTEDDTLPLLTSELRNYSMLLRGSTCLPLLNSRDLRPTWLKLLLTLKPNLVMQLFKEICTLQWQIGWVRIARWTFLMSGSLPIGHQLYCVSSMHVKSRIVTRTSCGLMLQLGLRTLTG